MPNESARTRMFQMHFSKLHTVLDSSHVQKCAHSTEGYSGADIQRLCKEIAMRQIRKIVTELEALEKDKNLKKVNFTQKSIYLDKLLKRFPIDQNDVEKSVLCTRPSSDSSLCARYKKWADDFGST